MCAVDPDHAPVVVDRGGTPCSLNNTSQCSTRSRHTVVHSLLQPPTQTSFIMADYGDYQTAGQATPLARNSYFSQHSAAPSTQSWSNSPRRIAAAPPPQPVNLPTPVQAVRPLPIPGRVSSAHSTGPLRVVNNPEPPPTARIDHILRRNTHDSDSGTATSGTPRTRGMWSNSSSGVRPRPPKKKSFVGGFFKGVKKLPRTMFGYGAGLGMSETSKLEYSDTSMTEGTSASETGNGLPAYSSNPSSPVGRVPARRMQYTSNIVPTEPTIHQSPLPNVVRLDDQRYSNIPSVYVSPPSGNQGENANFYGGAEYPDHPPNPINEFSAGNPGDRTTVMAYNDDNSHHYEYNRPAPTPLRHQISTSPALSYVEEHPPSPHSSAAPSTVRDPRAPIDAAQGNAPDPGTRLSYVTTTTYRPVLKNAPVGALQLSSAPTVQSLPQAQTSPQNQVGQVPNTTSPPQDVGSPLSVHPEPTNDYRKMTLSPSPTSHDTYTTATSYCDPSFSSLNPIEKFFKMLYNMPWVSHERVTVDYHPGEGTSKGRKRRAKPVASWYHGMLGNSRRSSATLDLLSSGTPSSPGTSLRASLAMAMSPRSPRSGHHRQSAERQKGRHHRSRHHQSSSHHHHRRHADASRKRKRDTGTSMGTTNTDTNNNSKKHTSSPLVPTVYPYHYPPYPYPAFSAFPVSAPAPAAMDSQPSQSSGQRLASPLGPRGSSQQPMVYAAPAAYSPYQPMMGAPQVFLLHSPTSPTQATNVGVPASLVPGGSHGGHAHSPAAQLHDLQKGEHSQRQPTPGAQAQGTAQNIPGAF